MSAALRGFTTGRDIATPQTERADVRQSRNNAGGFSFKVSDTDRVLRFLILGSDGGTYYVSEKALTQDNGNFLLDYITRGNGSELVTLVRDVSVSGRAPKNSAALFALALAATFGDTSVRDAAWRALPAVARTASHLFEFCAYAKQFGNKLSGRQARRGLSVWYESKDADQLAVQVLKYRNRSGWSHRDVLRVAHPRVEGASNALLGWVTHPERGVEGTPALVADHLHAQIVNGKALTDLVSRNSSLTWEMLPTHALSDPEVWRALLSRGMPLTAMIRNLGRMTAAGVFHNHRASVDAVVAALGNEDALRKARVHPFSVLLAQNTYASGAGIRGSLSWRPLRSITDALDGAFYAAFGNVEPTGKRTMLALDVSGSMGCSYITGSHLSACEGSAAMALVTMAVEKHVEVVGFSSVGGSRYSAGAEALVPLDLSPRRRLDDNVKAISNLPFGGTDCAMPMLHALDKGMDIDTFVVFTDSETWAGRVHPHTALQRYRERTGIPAKLVVVGMTATEFTIADPTDVGMLDVVGFDSAAPTLISDFARG